MLSHFKVQPVLCEVGSSQSKLNSNGFWLKCIYSWESLSGFSEMKQVCLGYASIFTAVKKNKIVKELLVLNEPWVTFSFFGRFHLLVLVWKFATWRFLSRNWITVTMTLSNGCAIYPDQDCMRQDADILLPGPWMTMRLLLTMFWYRLHCNSKSVWFCCIVRKQFHQPACFLSWDNQHTVATI